MTFGCSNIQMNEMMLSSVRHGSAIYASLYSLDIRDLKAKTGPVLWNRNYLLRFRFRFWLLESYGSGSIFWKVMVPVPVPTFEKVTVPVPVPIPAPYLDHKKQIFQINFEIFFDFLLWKLFYKEKVHKFQQIYGKMWMKKMFNEGNQIHNFMSSSGSVFLTSYGSCSGYGSTSQKGYGSYSSGSGSGSTTLDWTVPNDLCISLVSG